MSLPRKVDGGDSERDTFPDDDELPVERSAIRSQLWLPDGLRLERMIGYGSTGIVFAARTTSDALVAVKMLNANYAAEPQQRARLVREASAASRLSSQHVAKVFDVGERPTDRAPYIV